MRGCCSEGDGRERAREGATAVLRSIGRASSKAVEVPAGFPECGRGRLHGRREKERLCWDRCAETRPGRRLRASERPARDRHGMGGAMSCCQRHRGSALCAARCAGQGRRRRRTACSDLRPARQRAGVTPVQCPVLRAFVPCLPPTGCDAFGTALRSGPGPRQSSGGLCSRVPAARRRCGRAACPALPAGSSPETHGHRRAG